MNRFIIWSKWKCVTGKIHCLLRLLRFYLHVLLMFLFFPLWIADPFDLFPSNCKTLLIISSQFVCFVCMRAYCCMGCVEMEINARLLSAPLSLAPVGPGLFWGEGLLRIMTYTPRSHCQPGTAENAVMSDSEKTFKVLVLFWHKAQCCPRRASF